MKWLKRLLILAVILAAIGGAGFWYVFYKSNVTDAGEDYGLLIPREADYAYVRDKLESEGIISSSTTFNWVSSALKYPELIKPGYYRLHSGMSNIELVRKLRSGDQDPVRIQFLSYRRPPQLAAALTESLEMSDRAFLDLIENEDFLAGYGFNKQSMMSMFIPNTYEVYWTVKPEALFERMKEEYDRFWTAERKQQAESLNLTPLKVSALASIVQEETSKADERPMVAGLYLNRLRRGMLLQADPTVKFANNADTLKRVLFSHLEVDSPYNTYKYAGLPPGPINNPEQSALKAVLKPAEHNYIFMVAKCPLDGYHHFSTNNAQHERYAAEYRKCLKKLNIR